MQDNRTKCLTKPIIKYSKQKIYAHIESLLSDYLKIAQSYGWRVQQYL